jgi:hypothetical protein
MEKNETTTMKRITMSELFYRAGILIEECEFIPETGLIDYVGSELTDHDYSQEVQAMNANIMIEKMITMSTQDIERIKEYAQKELDLRGDT